MADVNIGGTVIERLFIPLQAARFAEIDVVRCCPVNGSVMVWKNE